MRAEQSRAEQSRAEQSRAEQRLSWLDVLKGIGIVLVAIGHIYSNRTVLIGYIPSICHCSFGQQAGCIKKKQF